jgi:hypothetical protein
VDALLADGEDGAVGVHCDAAHASAADRREEALAHGCNVEDEEAAAAHAEHLIKCYI